MPLQVPNTPGVTYQEMRLTLDGIDVGLVFRWNTREEAWYMDLLDSSDDVIFARQKVVVGDPLLWRDRRDPTVASLGLFQALDTSGHLADPGQNELGARVVLLYYSQAEVQDA